MRTIVAAAVLLLGVTALPAASEAQSDEERIDTDLTVRFAPDDRQGGQDQWYWINLEGTIDLEDLDFGDEDRISMSVFAGDWSQLQLKAGLGSDREIIFTSNGFGGFQLEQVDEKQSRLHFQRSNLMQASALEDPLDELPISVRLSSVGTPPDVLEVAITNAVVEVDNEPPHPVHLRAELPENALFDGEPNTLTLFLRGTEVPPDVCPDLRLDVSGDATSNGETECVFDNKGTLLQVDLTGTKSGGSARVNAVVDYPQVGPSAVAFTVQVVDAPSAGFFRSSWVLRFFAALIFAVLLVIATRLLRKQRSAESDESTAGVPVTVHT